MNTVSRSEFFVSKEQLMTLQWFKINQLAKEQRAFRIDWKNNKECDCVSTLENNQLPWCNHVRKAMKEQFKKNETQIWNRTLIIGMKSLPFDKLFN